MDGFDIRIQPMTHADFCVRMEQFGVIAGEGEFGTRIYYKTRMGVGSGDPYPVRCRGDNDVIFPPTIKSILGFFSVSIEEWKSAGEESSEEYGVG